MGNPTRTHQVLFWIKVSTIAKYHVINNQSEMFHCTKKAERVQWDEWATHGSAKIHSSVDAAKIRQQVPREIRLHSSFAYRNKNAGLLDPSGNPLPVKAKVRLVIHGQHCPDNAQGLVRTDAPTVHRTVVSVFLQIVASVEWCQSLRGVDVSFAFLRGEPREVEGSVGRLHVAYVESRKVP